MKITKKRLTRINLILILAAIVGLVGVIWPVFTRDQLGWVLGKNSPLLPGGWKVVMVISFFVIIIAALVNVFCTDRSDKEDEKE